MVTITGVKVHIKSDELRAHLKARAEAHRSRCNAFEKSAKDLLAEAADEERAGKGSGGPVAGLNSSADQHRKKALYFEFLAGHLVADAQYELTEQDMINLEIYQGRGY